MGQILTIRESLYWDIPFLAIAEGGLISLIFLYFRESYQADGVVVFWPILPGTILLLLGCIQGIRWADRDGAKGVKRLTILMQGIAIGTVPIGGLVLPLTLVNMGDSILLYSKWQNIPSLLGIFALLIACIVLCAFAAKRLPMMRKAVQAMRPVQKPRPTNIGASEEQSGTEELA